ncbi:MAG TPA: hypothetical protein DDW52_22905 [Planctomycetaceae bacterium]|nr:hypothetical protein [Planctomycetaceae bacterium]
MEKSYDISTVLAGQSLAFKLLLDKENITQRMMLDAFSRGGFFEVDVVRPMVKALRPGDHFLDVGGHIGYMSMLAASVVGLTGRVVTCEPEPNNFLHLVRHVQANPLATWLPMNLAVSDHRGLLDFYVNADNDGGHALWDVGRHDFNVKSRQQVDLRRVSAVTVDGLCSVLQLTPRVIKIDTEGAELAVLRGAEKTLERDDLLVIAEINHFGLKQMGTGETELREFMQSRGFTTYELNQESPPRALAADQPCDQDVVGNIMFSRLPIGE